MKRRICLFIVVQLSAAFPVAADTWELQNSGTGTDLSGVAILSTNDMVVVGDKSGTAFVVRYTTNGGTIWQTPSTPGAPVGNNLNALDFTGSTLVAVGKAGTITRSTDGGANWNFPVSPTTKELHVVAFLSSTIALAAGVKDGNDYTVVRSEDGGATWPILVPDGAADLTDPDINNNGVNLKAIAGSGANVVAVGEKSGGGPGATFTIIRSPGSGAGSGATWDIPASMAAVGIAGQHLNAVTFVSPTTVVAVGDNGTILTSTDAGATWDDEVSPTTQNLNAVIASGTIVVAIGDKNGAAFTVVRHTDSGVKRAPFNGFDWSAATTPAGAGEHLRAIDASSTRMAAVGDNGAILLSEDSGASWTAQNTGTLNNLFGVAIINPVIAVGQNGTILRSSDSQAASGGAGGTIGGAGVAVPFEGEWLLLVAIAGFGLYYLRPNRR